MARKIDSTSATLRSFAVLEAVVGARGPVSLPDIMDAVGLPKPTVHRIMTLLASAGFLLREPDGKRYIAGARLMQFGLDVLSTDAVRLERVAILQRLAAHIGETCNFTMLDRGEIVYLDRVETAWPLRMHLQPGSRVPMHCSASGKLLLAHLPKAQRTRIVSRLSLTSYTMNTIANRAQLVRELDRIRAQGYSTDNEEYLAGLTCVAVPVRRGRGKAVAAVAVQAPTSRMPLERGLQHLAALRTAADELAQTLDFSETPASPSRSRRAARKSIARSAQASRR